MVCLFFCKVLGWYISSRRSRGGSPFGGRRSNLHPKSGALIWVDEASDGEVSVPVDVGLGA